MILAWNFYSEGSGRLKWRLEHLVDEGAFLHVREVRCGKCGQKGHYKTTCSTSYSKLMLLFYLVFVSFLKAIILRRTSSSYHAVLARKAETPIQCIGVYSYSTTGESFALNLDLIKLVVNDINYHIYLHVYSKAVIRSSALAQSCDDYEYILLYNVRIKILLRTELIVHDECPSPSSSPPAPPSPPSQSPSLLPSPPQFWPPSGSSRSEEDAADQRVPDAEIKSQACSFHTDSYMINIMFI